VPYLVKYIDYLTNIYVRLNRKRFKGRTGEEDCRISLSTLYHVCIYPVAYTSSGRCCCKVSMYYWKWYFKANSYIICIVRVVLRWFCCFASMWDVNLNIWNNLGHQIGLFGTAYKLLMAKISWNQPKNTLFYSLFRPRLFPPAEADSDQLILTALFLYLYSLTE